MRIRVSMRGEYESQSSLNGFEVMRICGAYEWKAIDGKLARTLGGGLEELR